ncbi:MAG TPA: trypsin-like peptidase domain-containing protein [Ilumatobacter sp.]|nr:trypsin-like peptidase domain-containing protein [Ilumatobacter sp.]
MTRRERWRAGTVLATLAIASGCAPDPPVAIVGLSVNACDPGLEAGSGAIVAPGIVLTSAHVVAGAESIAVRQPGTGVVVDGTIVGFDPINDLAYVAVDDLIGQELQMATQQAVSGDTGTAYVVRDGMVVALPITIARPINIRTEDIYIDAMTNRPGYELVADIEPGDSGGVVLIDGEVIGIIWARSNLSANRAYAIDAIAAAAAIDQQLSSGEIDTDANGVLIDLTRCY